MNKLFTKITSLALGAAMMIGVGVAVGSNSIVEEANAASYSYTFSSKQFATNETKDLGGVSWTLSGDGNYWGYDSSKGQQFGSGSAPYKKFSLSTSGISGTISQIVVNASGGSKVSATISCTVGGNAFGTQSQSISASAANKTFNGSASGTIDITMSQTSSKALYIKTISVTYSSEPASLAAPTNISYNSTTQKVTWNAVTGATGYQYTLDNGSTWTAVTSFAERYLSVGSWTDGDYNLKLRANGNGTDYVKNGTASDNYAFTKQESPTYTGVTVTPGSLVGTEKGTAYIDLTATVQGTHGPSQVVSWKITSDTTYVDQTSISGKASIASTGDSTGRVTFDDNFTGYAWAVAADGTTKNYAQVVASGLVDGKGSQNNPYTVAESVAAVVAGSGITNVYTKGIVCGYYNNGYSTTPYLPSSGKFSFYLSDNGTAGQDGQGVATRIEAYKCCKNSNLDTFASLNETPKIGDVVIICGTLKSFTPSGKPMVYEYDENCYISSIYSVQNLSVSTQPETTYNVGDNFDPTGLVLTASYTGESSHTFSYADHSNLLTFDPDPSDVLVSTDTSVSIKLGSYETSLAITVNVAPAVTGITLDPTTKTAYFEDEFSIAASVTAEGGASTAITWSIEDSSALISIKNGSATNTGVTIVAGSTTGTAYVRATSVFNNEVYARCKVVIKDPNALVDTLTYSNVGVTGTSYSTWSGLTESTAAVYAGQTAGGNSTIQINSGKGIYNTATAGYVRQVKITIDNHTGTNNRTVTLYGYESAQSSITTSGENLGSVSYNGTDSVYTISVASANKFPYFVLTSNSAIYMDEVEITYEKILPTVSLNETSFTFDEGAAGNISVSATATNFTDNNSVVFSAVSQDQTLLDNSNISVSGNTVTISKSSVKPGTVTVVVTGTYETKSESATAEFTITCIAASRSLQSIEITTASSDTEFLVGNTFTISDLVVTGHYDSAPLTEDVTASCEFKLWNGSSETVLTPGSSTLGTSGDFTIRITHPQSEAAETLSYAIRVDEVPVYSEVEFTSLYEGAKVLLVSKDNSKAAGSYGSSLYNSVDVTIDEISGDITAWGSATEFTVRIYGDRVAFEYGDGKYIGYNGSGNAAHEQSSLVEKATWTYDENGLLSSTSGRYLEYNSGNPRFACYAHTQKQVSIFISSNSSKTDVLEASTFQYKYLHMRDYLGEEGSDGDGYCRNTGDGDGKNYFTDAVTYYSSASMSADARVKFGTTSDFAEARKRLIDWGKANSKNVVFDATTGDITVTQIGMSLINNMFATQESTATTIIIIISVIGVSALGGFFFLRKRKEI